jgi:hypothetical protein
MRSRTHTLKAPTPMDLARPTRWASLATIYFASDCIQAYWAARISRSKAPTQLISSKESR